MDKRELPPPIALLVDHLAAVPNVVAVTLGGSPAEGRAMTRRDWDLRVYYRDGFDPESLAHLDGTVTAPGDWGRIMNGGASLMVEGLEVDVHYRNLDDVRHWTREARDGRFEVDRAHGYLAGIPTYTLVAEVALGQVLAGSLNEVVEYPDQLAEQGAARWRNQARSSLGHAERQAAHGDIAGVMGHLVKASVEAAHARLCRARRWTVNEREILEQAELTHMTQILTALNTDPVVLTQRVMQARSLLLD